MWLFERWTRDAIPGAPLLFVEGLLTAGVGAGGALILFPDQVGLVAIFLCALGSLGSVERQLAWNRVRIVEQGDPPLRVNARFTGRLLALFAGQVLAFALVASLASVELLRAAFTVQLGAFAGAGFGHLAFPPPEVLLGHNLGVAALFFVLALLFRHGGALLAVAWNASVWGVVFGWLARGLAAEPGGPPLAEAWVRVMVGVLPHLALEATGYVLAGFAGVFLGLGLARYSARSEAWTTLARSVSGMLGAATILVSAGAFWEGLVAGPLCRWLAG